MAQHHGRSARLASNNCRAKSRIVWRDGTKRRSAPYCAIDEWLAGRNGEEPYETPSIRNPWIGRDRNCSAVPPGSASRSERSGPIVLTVTQVACEKVRGRGRGGGGAAVGAVHSQDDRLRARHGTRPKRAWKPTPIACASGRNESRMIGYHQGVAKAITGYWGNS